MSTVFLVDDSPEIRDVLTVLLSDEGFHVTAYDAAERVLPQIDVRPPDLLILDGRLTRMSGWQCLELLRTSEPTNRLPVLMLTAAIDELEQSRRAADDCTAYLAKPFDIDDLLTTLQDLMIVCAQSPA